MKNILNYIHKNSLWTWNITEKFRELEGLIKDLKHKNAMQSYDAMKNTW